VNLDNNESHWIDCPFYHNCSFTYHMYVSSYLVLTSTTTSFLFSLPTLFVHCPYQEKNIAHQWFFVPTITELITTWVTLCTSHLMFVLWKPSKQHSTGTQKAAQFRQNRCQFVSGLSICFQNLFKKQDFRILLWLVKVVF